VLESDEACSGSDPQGVSLERACGDFVKNRCPPKQEEFSKNAPQYV